MLRTANDAGSAAGPWSPPGRRPRPAVLPSAVADRVVGAGPAAADRLLAFADRYRWWLYGFTLLFYVASFNGQWRVQPDAALYLSIGRNLAEGHGYTYLGQTNKLAYPGWPLMIAATFKAFGSSSLVPVHGLQLLVALGALAATYRLFLLHSGRPTAVLVTVGTALTKSFFVYALELWSDLPFTMAAMGLLAGYEGAFGRPRAGGAARRSRWYDWALLVGGLATAMAIRPTAWPLLLAVVLSLGVGAVRGHLRWGTLAAVAAAVVVLAAACVAFDPRRAGGGEPFGGTYEQYLLHRMSGAVVPFDRPIQQKLYGLFAWAASDVLFQVRFGLAANAVLSGVVLALGFGLFRARALWGLWFTLLLATILLMVQETLDRYFLPVLPLLVFAWWSSLVWLDRRLGDGGNARGWRRWAASGVFLALLGFGGLTNLTKVGGLVAQQRTRPFLASYDRGRYAPVPALAAFVAGHVGPDGLVLVKPPYGRVTAFLSRRAVVTAAEATPLDLQTRPVFVVEPATDAMRALLDTAHLAEGPAVYTAPPPPPEAGKAEALSVHSTVPRSP